MRSASGPANTFGRMRERKMPDRGYRAAINPLSRILIFTWMVDDYNCADRAAQTSLTQHTVHLPSTASRPLTTNSLRLQSHTAMFGVAYKFN